MECGEGCVLTSPTIYQDIGKFTRQRQLNLSRTEAIPPRVFGGPLATPPSPPERPPWIGGCVVADLQVF